MTRPIHRRAALLLLGLLATLAALAGLSSPASAAPRQRVQEAVDAEGFSTLTLINGWVPYGNGTGAPKARVSHGIVELKGAMSSGSLPEAFTLPAGMHPSKKVIIPVDLCDAVNGRLIIKPSGSTRVQSEGPLSDAQCFTSLEGASFALNPAGQVPLTLQNGWVGGAANTRPVAAAVVDGVVHLTGAIQSPGTDPHPFVVPAGLRPAATVYVPVDLCNAEDGRLRIRSSGVVTVQTQNAFTLATCFTSLDGVSWVVDPTAQTALTLDNGWTGRPYGTRTPRAGLVDGVVRLSGAVSGGSTDVLFTLPPALRPNRLVYVQVDLCSAANGRLVIETNGETAVESENGGAGDAQCFTSLEDASFVR